MKKSSEKSSSVVIILVVFTSIILTAGIVKAASLTVDSLTVGKQGVGGVTYFNGTIINNTTTNGTDNPVTFGDNVRIDGSVYRGATAGSGDNKPFKINDDGEVVGNLTIGGNSTITGDLRVDGDIYSGTLKGPQSDGQQTVIDDNLNVNGVIGARGMVWTDEGLNVEGDTWLFKTLLVGGEAHFSSEAQFGGYVTLDSTNGQPPSSDCSWLTVGRMKFDDSSSSKLWVCSSMGWKSFSAD